MQYNITTKNVKQSVANLSNYFKDKGYKIPHSAVIEGFAKSLFFRNWNTLEAISDTVEIIEHIKPASTYLVEFDLQIDNKTLREIVEKSFSEGYTVINIKSLRSDGNQHHMELHSEIFMNNLMSGLAFLCQNLKEKGYVPTRMDYCMISISKESYMSYFKYPHLPIPAYPEPPKKIK
jgi:hypothetical protein